MNADILPLVGGSVPQRSTTNEIIVDSFAGGGGASTGFFLGLGRGPDIAINHDHEAVALHKMNHPEAKHFCESVWQVNPADIARLGPIGAAWFSPDCKHFSKAKGGKPLDKNIRGLARVVHTWSRLPAHQRPRVIFLENVEEFQKWGPLDEDGKPIESRIGEDFAEWCAVLRRHGYKIEWREIKACDFGAPTIRKRLFLIARCDGRPIIWPEPTHGPANHPDVIAGKMKPYRTAAEVIDWTIDCASIFDRDKPLAVNTLNRIAAGTLRYVLDAATPFIVKANHGGEGFRGQSIADPLQTITLKNGYGVAVPFLQHVQHSSAKNGTMPANEGLRTITAHPKGGGIALAAPFFSTYYGAKRPGETRGNAATGLLGTQTTENRHAVVSAFISRQFGNSIGHAATDPTGTVTCGGGGKSQLVTPFLTKFRTGAVGSSALAPFPTITASSWTKRPGGNPPLGIIAPVLTKHYGGVIGHGVTRPIGTVTTIDHHSVTAPVLVKYYGNDKDGQDLGQPAHTVTATDRFALSTAFLSHYYSSAEDGGNGNLNHPAKTITATGQHHSLVTAVIAPPYLVHGLPWFAADFARFQHERTQRVARFLFTHSLKRKTKGGFREWSAHVARFVNPLGGWKPITVTVRGELYVMTDIGMRMLQPRELYNAQGFPPDYIIDFNLNGKKLPKHAQVRMCGNSVSPPPAAALIAANVPELAVSTLQAAE